MDKILPIAALLFASAIAMPALAEEGCGHAPRDQWIKEEAIKSKVAAMGYEVRRVKAEGGCYEVYAIDKTGAKVELTLNPVTGERINGKDDD